MNLFLDVKHTPKIQKYINLNWRKDHILAKNNKLIFWQHCFKKNKIDFLCELKKKKLISILGIINQSRDHKYSEISMAIWHARETLSGIRIMSKILNSTHFKTIKATTISKKARNLYKAMGFNVNFFNNYYITHLSKENQVITQNLQKSLICQKNQSEKTPFFEVNKIFFYVKKKNIRKYTKWRFLDHPIYKYFFIISEDEKLILIFRVVNVENRQFIKVVDFIGSFMNQKKFIDSLTIFLKQNNFDYLEFLHFGFEDKYIIKSGFKKLNIIKKQIMPIFHEPYLGLKNHKLCCGIKCISKSYKLKIVRADGDSDRPSYNL